MFQYWTPPSRRLPPLLWIRIKAEIGSYIVSRGADGVRVNTWYHRQFIEVARERYLANEHKTKISKSLGEYFLGTWASRDKPYFDKDGNNLEADRLVAKQPLVFANKENMENIVFNLRKFSELPYALIGAKMRLMSNTGNLSPMDKSIRQVLRWIRWSSFFKIHSHVTSILIHYVTNANIITM